MTAFNSARFAANFFTSSARFCSRLISASFAMAASVSERKFECGEKRLRFIVGLCGSGNANIHPAQSVNLLIFNFRKNDLLFHTDVVVTTTIEGAPGYTTKIANARQSNGNQAV